MITTDITGQKFGMLTALCRTKNSLWKCKCDCGNTVYKTYHDLRYCNSKTINCGCYTATTKLHDLVGQRFGLLTVIKRMPNNTSNKVQWLCKCDCGNERIAIGTRLMQGYIVSCGCVKSDKQRLLQIWADMLGRCTKPSYKCWKFYGGKGITVCDEWHSYENFKSWAYANGYTQELTLDRIDSSKNYEPSNCRWITLRENQLRGFDTACKNQLAKGRFLSNEDIDYILEHRSTPVVELAKKFNHCEQSIRNVWNGITKKKERKQ